MMARSLRFLRDRLAENVERMTTRETEVVRCHRHHRHPPLDHPLARKKVEAVEQSSLAGTDSQDQDQDPHLDRKHGKLARSIWWMKMQMHPQFPPQGGRRYTVSVRKSALTGCENAEFWTGTARISRFTLTHTKRWPWKAGRRQ
jgi:hypothetical protein